MRRRGRRRRWRPKRRRQPKLLWRWWYIAKNEQNQKQQQQCADAVSRNNKFGGVDGETMRLTNVQPHAHTYIVVRMARGRSWNRRFEMAVVVVVCRVSKLRNKSQRKSTGGASNTEDAKLWALINERHDDHSELGESSCERDEQLREMRYAICAICAKCCVLSQFARPVSWLGECQLATALFQRPKLWKQLAERAVDMNSCAVCLSALTLFVYMWLSAAEKINRSSVWWRCEAGRCGVRWTRCVSL